jgi:uroporphyrinogen decarboxylase
MITTLGDAMNGKQRIITALEVKEADRVPLYIHGINEAPIIGIGKYLTDGLPEPQQFRDMTDPDKLKLLDTLFLLHESYEIDGFTTFEIGHEKKLDDLHVEDDFGVIYEISAHGIPVARQHPLKNADDLKKYTPPVPNRNHLLLLDMARARFKDEKAIFWLMRGAYVRSWRLIGMENMMMQMYDDPQFIHDVAQMTLDYNMAQLEMLIDAGLDVLVIEDDIAGNEFPLISPDSFKEFVNKYNRQLVDRAHEAGLKVVRHSDGNLWKLMDILLETGYDGLNPLEPQADMSLKKVKDYCGDRLCLLGNIDCQELLPSGTPEEVDQAVKQAIEDAGAGGGLIICSSNSLHPAVDPENCIAMFEATKKYGKYGG